MYIIYKTKCLFGVLFIPCFFLVLILRGGVEGAGQCLLIAYTLLTFQFKPTYLLLLHQLAQTSSVR